MIVLMCAVILVSARISSITVIGNTRYSRDEVIRMIFSDPWDRNIAYQLIKDRTKPHKQLPFVERYDLQWNGIDKVEVIVYEKNVVGYVNYMSSHMYFDKDGIIVESTGERLEGIPEIRGLKFGSIVLYRPLPVQKQKVFRDILNLTGLLRDYEISCDEISYDSLLNATLQLGDIEVQLGSDESMEMKISTLCDILPKLEGKQGKLDLSTYGKITDKEAYIFTVR